MDALADMIGEVQAETLSDTFTKVKAQLLVVAVHVKPRRSEILSDTLAEVKRKALVDVRETR